MRPISIPKLSTVYITIWGGALILLSFNLVIILTPITFFLLFIAFVIPVTLILFFEYLFQLLYKERWATIEKFKFDLKRRNQVVHLLFYIWSTLTVIDLISSGFLPIMAGGTSDLNYTDYGVKVLGGINNAFALTLSFVYSLMFLYHLERKRAIYSILTISTWQILTLRRGVLFSILIIFILIHLFKNFKELKNVIFKATLLCLSLISLFGVLGDIRGAERPFTPLVRDQYLDFFNNIPSGFLWVYIYITSSLQNLHNNLNLLVGDCSDIFFPLLSLAPSIVRPVGKCFFYLESEFLNVGSYLSLYLVSGNIIAFSVYLTLPIMVTTFIRQKFLNTYNIGYLGAYTVLLLCWILSPFTNLFFLPTYVLCPIMLLLMFLIKL